MTTYLGPKTQIQPADLSRYDNGKWAAEEKHDGHWAEVVTDAEGKVISITGRSGKTFSNMNVHGLLGMQTGLANSVFATEIEAGTEAANQRFDKLGYRRLWAFDLIKLLGQDVTRLPYEKRRELLEMAVTKVNSPKFQVTRRVTSGFASFYEDVMNGEGEGLVLKRLGTSYNPYGASGKTDDWVRCKAFRYVDYVVTEIGKSDGGSDNFQVGLFFGKQLQRVATIKNLPKEITNPHAFVGKVIECKGLEMHKSGALRHGHFERLREDKFPEECTYEAAQNS